VVSKLGFPLVRYPLTFDDEDLEGIEGWIQCVSTHLLTTSSCPAFLPARCCCVHRSGVLHAKHCIRQWLAHWRIVDSYVLTHFAAGQICEQR
jgi:hypothetical protein